MCMGKIQDSENEETSSEGKSRWIWFYIILIIWFDELRVILYYYTIPSDVYF